jgi:hypothetical protein
MTPTRVGDDIAAQIVVSFVVSAALGVTGWFVRAAMKDRKAEYPSER